MKDIWLFGGRKEFLSNELCEPWRRERKYLARLIKIISYPKPWEIPLITYSNYVSLLFFYFKLSFRLFKPNNILHVCKTILSHCIQFVIILPLLKDNNQLDTQKTISLDCKEKQAREDRHGNFKISKLINFNTQSPLYG